jgi:hypothetical protein
MISLATHRPFTRNQIIALYSFITATILVILGWFVQPWAKIYIEERLATSTPTITTTPKPSPTPSPTQTITITPIGTITTAPSQTQTSTSTLSPTLTPTPSSTPTTTPTLIPTISAVIIPIDIIKYGCNQNIYDQNGGYLVVPIQGISSDPQAPENFELKWDVSAVESFAGCTIEFPSEYDNTIQTAQYLVVWIQGSPSQAQFEIGMTGCWDENCTVRDEWNEKITLSELGRQVVIRLDRPEKNGQRLLVIEKLVIGFSHIFGAGSETGIVYIGGVGFAP